MYRTISEIKAANKAAGMFFFERSSMRFFDSRIESKVYGGRFFITSEQFHGSDGRSAPRLYTIRECKADGDIDTVGTFQQYRHVSDARDAARLLVAQMKTVNEVLREVLAEEGVTA